jgi:hypothetical protein
VAANGGPVKHLLLVLLPPGHQRRGRERRALVHHSRGAAVDPGPAGVHIGSGPDPVLDRRRRLVVDVGGLRPADLRQVDGAVGRGRGPAQHL